MHEKRICLVGHTIEAEPGACVCTDPMFQIWSHFSITTAQ